MAAAVLWWRVTRSLATRRLQMLWTVVTTACPSVVLNRELLAASAHGQRLAAERLPVEIHDGWLYLRYYLTEAHVAVVDDPSRRSGCDNATVAATHLMLAIQHKNLPGARPTAAPPVEHLGTSEHKTLVAEVRFLCEVSKKLRSRFVRDVLAGIPAESDNVALPHTI